MGRKLLVASLLMAALLLWAVFGLNRPTAIYSLSVSQFLRRGMADETVRVRGVLVHGSLCKVTAECGYRFILEDAVDWSPDGRLRAPSAQQLPVSYDGCVIPDTFRDVPGMDIDVSAEGERCQGCHDFKAERLMAKCPAKYEMKGHYAVPAAPPPLCQALPRM